MNTSQMDSPAAGSKKERRTENIVPLPINTIISNKEEVFLHEDRPVNMVTIVGIVRSVEVSSTKVSYVIDDHTATINVIKYADGDNDEAPIDTLAEGAYAKVFGPVRTQQGVKHIQGYVVRQVEDMNMITSHLLDVIHHSLKLKQFNNSTSAVGNASAILPNSSIMQPTSARAGLGPDKDLVYATIKSSNAEEGMNKNTIKSVLQGQLKPDRIEKILEELSSDGIVYTTHDEDHFQVIDS